MTGDISTAAAKVRVLVIPTDEELVIARDVERFEINRIHEKSTLLRRSIFVLKNNLPFG